MRPTLIEMSTQTSSDLDHRPSPLPLTRSNELGPNFTPIGRLPMPSIKEVDDVPKNFRFHRERKRCAVLDAVTGDDSGGDEWRNILQDYWPCLKKGVIIPRPIHD